MGLLAKAVIVMILLVIDIALFACVKAGADADKRMDGMQKNWRDEQKNGEEDSEL